MSVAVDGNHGVIAGSHQHMDVLNRAQIQALAGVTAYLFPPHKEETGPASMPAASEPEHCRQLLTSDATLTHTQAGVIGKSKTVDVGPAAEARHFIRHREAPVWLYPGLFKTRAKYLFIIKGKDKG
jgi:hypothetical protein